MIELIKLQEMFSEIRANTSWNVDGPMLWGYFFMDRNVEKLERATTRLTAMGYRPVEIHEADDGSTLVLHVERVEVHSPQTLFARNEEFYELANQFGLDCYDGMDVGPATS